jgi:predicted nucleic-acid-binding protein
VRAIDTNVLVRLLTRDDATQLAAAEAFVKSGAWVSHLALAEAIWVLTAVYELDASTIATAIEMLLNHEMLVLEEPEVVTNALDHFRRRPALGFSDCLVLEIARRAAHLPLGTFDRALGRLAGVERL